MPTYKDVTEWVKTNRGCSAQPCWISECKAIYLGLPNPELNRDGSIRKKQAKQPLTDENKQAIMDAFAAIGEPDGRRL